VDIWIKSVLLSKFYFCSSRYSVPQDSWIEIKIVRVEERIILNVDNQTSVHNFDRTEKYMDLNAGSNLYIGKP